MVSSLRIKAAVRRESIVSRLAHVIPLVVGGVLIGWRDMPWRDLNLRLWPHSLLAYGIGLALLVAGLAFAVWARVHLGRNWSGSVTVKEGHELIRSGPYACVRHPIYTGLITAVLGTAIISGTLRAALGLVIITVSLLRKLRTEEAFMRDTFPGEYQRYCAQVPALVPFTRVPQSAPH
jgi:protein-S-isoprenylcysteine O-methyltransferase Ste14